VPENDHWDPGYTAAELAIVTPDAVFDAHEELARAPAIAPGAPESAGAAAVPRTDAVVQAVLDRLAAADLRILKGSSRVTVRVAADGVEIEVTVERGTADRKEATRRVKRRHRPSTRKHVGGSSRRR
jgi:hypothetical protein